VCVVCECFVILNPYIYLAVGAAPQRKRGGKTPTSLVAIAAAVAATHVLHPERRDAHHGGRDAHQPRRHRRRHRGHPCAPHSEGETPTSLVAVAAAVATGGEPVEPEQHAAADEPEQCALGEHAAADEPEQCALGEFNRLDGNAYATAAEASGRADESLQGSANEPEQHARRAGRLKDAPQALAPIVEETAGGIAALAPAGAGAVRELAAADAVTTGARVTLAHIQPCRDGANGFVAAVRWALNAVVRHVQPVIIGFLLTYLAYLAAARAVSTTDTTARVRVVPGFAVPRVFASHDLNWLHDSEAYVVGAGAARELDVSTPIGPLAATVSSRHASLLPAAWAPPPAPAQSCSSSCAFPASSMSPGGMYDISSDEMVFAGDTLECGFASNCDDSPGRGGADGTGAEEPNYVSDKANQDQKPGGFFLTTGHPPGNTAAGALSAGKLESRRGPPGGAAAGALSAGKLESRRGPPGGAAAGVISAGALKLESTGRPPGGAAPGALSAGAIIVTDSVKSVADCFPGAKRVAGGGYEISLDEILFADDTQSNTTTAAPADVSPLREINTEDDVAGAEGEAIESIEVQPGLASDAPGYGGADEDDPPSRGGVDAAGLEEHSSDSSNE